METQICEECGREFEINDYNEHINKDRERYKASMCESNRKIIYIEFSIDNKIVSVLTDKNKIKWN